MLIAPIYQVAKAAIEDPSNKEAIDGAVSHFIGGGSWDGSVHRLLPTAIAVVKKHELSHEIWPVAAEVLDLALDAKYRGQA